MATITDSDGWVPVTRPEITDIALGGNETSFPGKFFRELASRDQYLYETALGGDASSIASAVAFRKLGTAAVAQGRLTLEAGVPVSTTDQTAKTILYYTPYKGDYVALYDNVNTRWDLYQFTERSLSLSGLAADTNYDVFIYDNSGILTLEAVAWSSSAAGASTRAYAISQLDGVWVKNSDNRRLLGTIRTTSTTGECEDSTFRRFVCDLSNPVSRSLRKAAGGTNTYSTPTYRYFNADSTNKLEIVNALGQNLVLVLSSSLTGLAANVATDLNSSTGQNILNSINAADFADSTNPDDAATLADGSSSHFDIGYNFLAIIQKGDISTAGRTPRFYSYNVVGNILC